MQNVNSDFWQKLQEDAVELVTVIDLITVNTTFHWTLGNEPITAPFSGVDTEYEVGPIRSDLRQKQSSDLSVENAGFGVANSGDVLSALLEVEDLDFASLNVRRVFADTPGLGFLQIFEGQIGDQSHDRNNISLNVRNRWQSLSREWPHYRYQDTCIWRFGGAGCGFDISTVTLTFTEGDLITGSSDRIALRFQNMTLIGSFDNDWFALGKLSFSSGKNAGVIRTIRSHSGDLIQLSRPLPFPVHSTDVFSMAPGCRKRLVADCASKYNNVQSGYAGFRWIPILEDGNQPIPRG